MDFDDLVTLLVDYMRNNGDYLERVEGPEVRLLVEEIADLVEERLVMEQYSSLWVQFTKRPQANRAELVGALEMFTEAETGFAEHLEGLMEQYNALVGTPVVTANDQDQPQLVGADVDADSAPMPSVGDARAGGESDGSYIYGDIYNEF